MLMVHIASAAQRNKKNESLSTIGWESKRYNNIVL